jgi:hypothetical protein
MQMAGLAYSSRALLTVRLRVRRCAESERSRPGRVERRASRHWVQQNRFTEPTKRVGLLG